jgi:tRNA 2-thiouridine synthesizing protein A
VTAPEITSEERNPEASWDAGDLGCGELVLGLFTRIKAVKPGGIFRLIVRDPAAPEDIPAWCRMTGHPLVRSAHPEYLIQRKEN